MDIYDDPKLREELLAEFTAEALEHLDAAEDVLLAAETQGVEQDKLTIAMRAMHSIKGSASYLGLEAIQTIAHSGETAIQRLESGNEAILVPLLLEAVRELRQMAEQPSNNVEASPTLLASLEAVASCQTTTDHGVGRLSSQHSVDQVFLDVASQQCQALRAAADRLAGDPHDSTASDMVSRAIESLTRAAEYAGATDLLALLQPIATTDGIDSEIICSLAVSLEQLLGTAFSASRRREHTRSSATEIESGSTRGEPPGMRTLRVSQQRVDRLFDSISELVTVRNQLQHFLTSLEADSWDASSRRQAKALSFCLGKAVDDVQNSAMELRLVRLETIFRPLARVARDVAARTGKQVNLQVAGTEIEADKAVAEVIADPLVHLVRNAVDHGIESERNRISSGKPPSGLVQIVARREGNCIVIDVVDDGNGIDPDAVRSRVVAQGLLPSAEAQRLSIGELYNFLFRPGFSTALTVTEISGRGTGLDVVKTNVNRLGGSVTIQSAYGEGTRIQLRLPERLAAQDILLVSLGTETVGVPLNIVRQTLAIPREQLTNFGGGPAAVIRRQVVPLISMGELLGLPGGFPDSGSLQVLFIEPACDWHLGLVVDEIGQHYQAVVRPLVGIIARDGILGAAVLADGRLVLVVDPIALVETSPRLSSHLPPALGAVDSLSAHSPVDTIDAGP